MTRFKGNPSRWLIIGLVLVAAILIGAVALAIKPGQSGSISDVPSTRTLGPSAAPVTVTEYGDFGCITCRAWHYQDNINKIHDAYGTQVHFVWRDLPVITADSPKAAEAGWCAADQDKFWEFHDLVYAKFQIDLDSLKSYAVQLGLDTARFNQCLDSGLHRADVDRDWQIAEAHGFRATPSFTVNDRPFAGPITLSQLQSLIDPILKSGN